MSPRPERITREADELPIASQLDLELHLREQCHPDDEAAIEAEWNEEIAARADDIRKGRIDLMSGDEFRRRADALLEELGIGRDSHEA